MSYTVRLTTRAAADVRSIFRYIVARSPQGAAKWNDAYEAAIERLENQPLLCGLAAENEWFDFEMRQILFKTIAGKPYRAVFRIENHEIIVFRVRGHGQAPVTPKDLPNG